MSDKENTGAEQEKSEIPNVTTKESLREFLLNIRDKMTDRAAAPIYALTALNHIMNLSQIYELLDKENKEIARDIWLRLKQAGFQLKNPPLLFGPEEGSSQKESQG